MTDDSSMEQLSPERLARLLDLPAAGWDAGDQAAALKHQLSAPLLPDLATAPGARMEEMAALLERHGAPRSFGELFTGGAHPQELLELSKQWARQLQGHHKSAFRRPRDGALLRRHRSGPDPARQKNHTSLGAGTAGRIRMVGGAGGRGGIARHIQ